MFIATDFLSLACGMLACACAVGLMRFGWERGTSFRKLYTAAGWAMLVVALTVMSRRDGIVVGTTITLLAFSLCGFVAVAINMERRIARSRPARIAAPAVVGQSKGAWWGRGLTTFFLAMIAALAIGSAGAGLPLGRPADRVTIGGIILPIFWAGFGIWALSDPRPRRPAIGLAAIGLCSGVVIAAELMA